MNQRLIDHRNRELALRRWQLEHQGTRIRELADWLSTRPTDGSPATLGVARIVGAVTPGYLSDCEAAGVQP